MWSFVHATSPGAATELMQLAVDDASKWLRSTKRSRETSPIRAQAPRAAMRAPSTDKGEARGEAAREGAPLEPSTVKVNGKTAKVMSTDGGAPYKFEGMVDLTAGSNMVTVEAKDGNNNTATKTYSVSTTGTAKTFEYDLNGNLRFEKQPNGTVIREYRWDQQNRLVRAIIGTHESVYEYDGESRRVRIKELENSVQTKDETFVWCGGRICQKRSGGTIERVYFDQGFKESASVYPHSRDHLGSVREVVGGDGTTPTSRLSYSPWGDLTETGSGATSDVAFTGHRVDRATGLSLTLFRAYSPSLGRWLSADPLGLKGGWNLVAYVSNQPVLQTDSSGLLPDRDRAPRMPTLPELPSTCKEWCKFKYEMALEICESKKPVEPSGDVCWYPRWPKEEPEYLVQSLCKQVSLGLAILCIERCEGIPSGPRPIPRTDPDKIFGPEPPRTASR